MGNRWKDGEDSFINAKRGVAVFGVLLSESMRSMRVRILPVGRRQVAYHDSFFVKVKNEIGVGER